MPNYMLFGLLTVKAWFFKTYNSTSKWRRWDNHYNDHK